MRMFQAHDQKRVSRVRFGPDARTLSVAVRRHTGLVHLDLLSGGVETWEAGGGTPADVAYSADGGVLVVADHYGLVRPFRRTERVLPSADVMPFRHTEARPLAELRVGDLLTTTGRAPDTTLAFPPAAEPEWARLAVAGGELLLWHPVTQEYIVAPEEGDYRGVAFGPDGTTVTSIEYHAHALCVWNVKPFRVLFRTDLRGIDTFDNGSVAMLPDGERVIVAAGELLRCVPIHGGTGWDTTTKKPPLEIALHPSGRMLLVADGSKKVTAYDTGNGKVSAQFDWGIGKIGCVTYSPDGTLAAAGGEKGQVVVWDAE